MGEKKHTINLVFTIALLGIFALSALFVAVLGAQVYGRTAEKMDENYSSRTSLVYITEKIRQCPGKDISIEDVEGNQALVLTQEIDGAKYESWIFEADHKLREVMVPAGTPVSAIDGQAIMDVNLFSLGLEDDLLKIIVFDKNGGENTVMISVRD